MKAIIFDFDGVIHDTFDFHRAKIKEFTNVELSEQEFRDIHNGNFFNSIPEAFRDIEWTEYRDYIYQDQSELVIDDEIRDVIMELSTTHELFIVTSGGSKNISDYLHNNKIGSVFREILGLETCRSKTEKFKFLFEKHGLLSDDCVFVTDTLGDILEANKVGVRTIGVDYGFHEHDTLKRGEPHTIISHLNELHLVINDMKNYK